MKIVIKHNKNDDFIENSDDDVNDASDNDDKGEDL